MSGHRYDKGKEIDQKTIRIQKSTLRPDGPRVLFLILNYFVILTLHLAYLLLSGM